MIRQKEVGICESYLIACNYDSMFDESWFYTLNTMCYVFILVLCV